MSKYKTLRLVLGDQQNISHSWYEEKDKNTLYVLMECLSETDYVRHHIQKVVGYFLSMRHFAEVLKKQGHQVKYYHLDDKDNEQTISGNIKVLVKKHDVEQFEYQLPDEYRLDEEMKQLADELNIPVKSVDSEHFLSSRDAVEKMFEGKKIYLLETFYRKMRTRYNVLMEDDGETPLAGRWNYDAENRKKLPKKHEVPPAFDQTKDATEIVNLIEKKRRKNHWADS